MSAEEEFDVITDGAGTGQGPLFEEHRHIPFHHHGGKAEGRNSKVGLAAAREHLLGLQRTHGLTDEGAAWVLQGLDPFHDNAFRIVDDPSGGAERSVVQTINFGATLSAPSAVLAAGDKWDCAIATTPVNQTLEFMNYDQVQGSAFQTDGQVPMGEIGLVTASVVATGGLTWPSAAGGVPIATGTSAYRLGISPTRMTGDGDVTNDFLNGRTRIVGLAYEVVNSTPPLQAGGQVIPWRQNQQPTTNVITNVGQYTGGIIQQPTANGEIYAMPPASKSEALLLSQGQSFPAAAGLYQIVTRAQAEEPYSYPTATAHVLAAGQQRMGGYQVAPVYGINPTKTFSGPYASGPLAPTNATTNALSARVIPLSYNNMDAAGSYWTGLSPETTLEVNVRLFLAKAPNISDQQLITLAQPAPAYDPIAYQIYSEARRHLPNGVPLSHNAMGDWFRHVVDVVKHYALPSIEKALPSVLAAGAASGGDPFAMGAAGFGSLASQAAGVVAARGGKKKKKKKVQGLEVQVAERKREAAKLKSIKTKARRREAISLGRR